MGYLDDVFGVGGVPYPTAPGAAVPPACGTGPFVAPRRSDFFDRLFAPTQIAYPVPACSVALPGEVLSPERCAAMGGRTVRAFSLSPEFVASSDASATEEMIETMTGEPLDARTITKNAAPLAFVVPEGCDAVDILFGPVEVNPGVGRDVDLDEAISVSAVRFSTTLDRALVPGEQFSVTVPWRGASFAHLGAGRLRVLVIARFYKKS